MIWAKSQPALHGNEWLCVFKTSRDTFALPFCWLLSKQPAWNYPFQWSSSLLSVVNILCLIHILCVIFLALLFSKAMCVYRTSAMSLHWGEAVGIPAAPRESLISRNFSGKELRAINLANREYRKVWKKYQKTHSIRSKNIYTAKTKPIFCNIRDTLVFKNTLPFCSYRNIPGMAAFLALKRPFHCFPYPEVVQNISVELCSEFQDWNMDLIKNRSDQYWLKL